MLKQLNIVNFATVDHLNVSFSDGFNMLTGETGTGKSIIIDAIELLVGGKAKTDIVRTGESAAIIEGVFALKGDCDVRVSDTLAKIGIQKSYGEEILIRREVQASGRSRIFLNDQIVTLSTIKNIQPQILEIHGQGGQRELMEARTHLEMLDSYAGSTKLRCKVGEAFTRLKDAERQLQTLENQLVEKEKNIDFLRFQLSEIKALAPRPGEDQSLQAEKKLLAHAEQALKLSNAVYQDLYEGDRCVLENLSLVRRRLQQLAVLDSRLVALPDALDASIASLTEVIDVLRGYDEKLDYSAKKLEDIDNRLQELETLKRKYGCELEDFNEVVDGIETNLQNWENLELQETAIKDEIEEAKNDYIPLAVQLTDRRRAAIRTLEHKMVESLVEMSMDRTRFVVRIDSADADESATTLGPEARTYEQSQIEKPSSLTFFSVRGADRVEFLFSANLGESPRPLGRVASGGELSRLMLSLIGTIMDAQKKNEDSSPEIVVFDEIDAGIGGRAAEAVGQRLQLLATKKQVLCVTHQAQIARFADHHFALSKSVEKDRTTTRIQELSFEEKVSELARMVGGDEEAEVTRQTARWMLKTGVRKGHSMRKRKEANKSI